MKQEMILKLSIVIVAIITVLLSLPPRAMAQSEGFTFAPVVKRFDSSPDGGLFFNCDKCKGNIAGPRAFNNRGDLALAAETNGFCFDGLFLKTGDKTVALADRCRPQIPGRFVGLEEVNINNQGQAVLRAESLLTGDQSVNALYLYSAGQLTKIVAEGDPTPTGTTFKGCGFRAPSINDSGEVAFHTCTVNSLGVLRDEIFLFSGGAIRRVVTTGDPSPVGGVFVFNNFSLPPDINNNGEIFFDSSVAETPDAARTVYGRFLATREGFKKVVMEGEPMPTGGVVAPFIPMPGSLNDKGEVAFSVGLDDGQPDGGIFLYSGSTISKVMAEGDPTPIGGKFSSQREQRLLEEFPGPRINNNGAVAFKSPVKRGSASLAIFLASTKATVKVVAVGDRLPTGEKIQRIDTFALNDLGEVAFFAYDKDNIALGVFKATPIAPQIESIKLKRKKGALELRVTGHAMITNDTVIEVNGVALGQVDYPSDFQESGGTTSRVTSRDTRLEQLLRAGQTVQVTLFNSLTNLHSAPKPFTR